MLAKTRGFVLRETKFRDQSKICLLYTEEFGRISVLLKGARNPKSRLSGLFSTANLVELVLYRKPDRELHLVKEARLLASPMQGNADLERYTVLYQLLDLLRQATNPEDNDKRLFTALAKTISFITTEGSDPCLGLAWFLVHLACSLGFSPNLRNCAVTGRQITASSNTALCFLPHLGGAAYETEARLKSEERRPLSTTAYRLLSLLVHQDLQTLSRLGVPRDESCALSTLLHEYCSLHAGHRPRPGSDRILQQLISETER